MNDTIHSKSLVLIVGAGASKEVNLPVGAELRIRIAQALDIRYEHGVRRIHGDGAIDEALRALTRESIIPFSRDANPYFESSRRIRDAMPQAISIDNFIDSHRDDVFIVSCGKLAIARCILLAEAGSALFVNQQNRNAHINFAGVEDTWFNAFFQLLTENCQESEVDQRLSQVAIVSFNYDRCIAHYLHGALQNYYGITPARAAQALSNLQIFHPYGSVGQLPWQSPSDGVGYGSDVGGESLVRVSTRIRTFAEGIDPVLSNIVRIRKALECARKVVFLGFAFHRLNLKLLFPGLADGQQILNRPTYATGYGISDADGEEIRCELSALGAVFPDRFYFRNDLTCAKLFREFWRSLALQG